MLFTVCGLHSFYWVRVHVCVFDRMRKRGKKEYRIEKRRGRGVVDSVKEREREERERVRWEEEEKRRSKRERERRMKKRDRGRARARERKKKRKEMKRR